MDNRNINQADAADSTKPKRRGAIEPSVNLFVDCEALDKMLADLSKVEAEMEALQSRHIRFQKYSCKIIPIKASPTDRSVK